MGPQNRDEEKTRRTREFLLENLYIGGTKTCSIEAAGVALLGLAMTRIADAIERAEKHDWPDKSR